MKQVAVRKDGKFIYVSSQYNPDLPEKARKIGGDWTGSEWKFDIRDEERVRKIYLDIYGDDGTCIDFVTIRIKTKQQIYTGRSGIYLAGREIARATGRDSGAKLGEGIVVLEGCFDSGGSMKNWATESSEIVEFEIRDLPKLAAERLINEYKTSTVRNLSRLETVEIVEYGNEKRDALELELMRLKKRIAEIELELAQSV